MPLGFALPASNWYLLRNSTTFMMAGFMYVFFVIAVSSFAYLLMNTFLLFTI